jgi:AcrR family transcriptional regulator
MQDFILKISIQVCDKIYLKDPESSELGKKIITHSIDMIDALGFDTFTFGKLSKQIGSPEASIYRYFESKHKLLLYLTSWYWGWMEYRLVFGLSNISSPEERLRRAIVLLTQQIEEDNSFSHINEVKLHRILVSESAKAYLTRDVDAENSDGAFGRYKDMVSRVSELILEINPKYKYPHMLITTVIEGAHHQRFFSEHLPQLTDVVKGEDSICTFYSDLVFKMIQ